MARATTVNSILTPRFLRLAGVAGLLASGAALSGMAPQQHAGIAIASIAMTAPEPDPVSRRWELDLEVGDLRIASVTDAAGQSRNYFYLTYKVTNNSGQDVLLAPIWELSTGSGPIERSGRGVPLSVSKQLAESTQNPYIEDQISIVGMILQGQDNAKEGVVIWPVNREDVDSLTIHAAGFSGETATVIRPDTKDKVVLRKSFMLNYQAPGSLKGQIDPLPVAERRWIMR